MNISIASLLFILIFAYLSYEDYKTKYVDIRICGLLFLTSLLYVYLSQEISFIQYLYNMICGFFFMIFIYVLGLKNFKCNKDDETNEELVDIPVLGFIPSFAIASIIYYFVRNNYEIKNIINFSDLFINEFGLYLILILTIYIVFKLLYVYLQTKKNFILITGFGDGDVIILTIIISLISISSFLVIFFIALIIHLFTYLLLLFKRKDTLHV